MTSHRLAIVGFGKIARDQHVPAIARTPGLDLAAVVSAHAATVPGVERVFASASDLYRDAPDVDCVALCTSPANRFELAREALLAGKHVLLEKPPAATLGEARTLVALAERKGLTLFATWHARANPAVREAARRLSGREVKSLRVVWREDVRHWHPGQAWIWQAGGFGVFDPGINALSIVTAILPGEAFVRSATLAFPANRQQPIAAEIVFGAEPPASGELRAEFDWRQTGPQTWDIEVETADGGRLRLSEGGARLEIDGKEVETPPSSEYPDLYARFADLLAAGERDVDFRPFELVADAFLCGERRTVEAFED